MAKNSFFAALRSRLTGNKVEPTQMIEKIEDNGDNWQPTILESGGQALLELTENQDWNVSTYAIYAQGDLINNRYQVEECFQGAMGYVYIAHDKKQDIQFAIKQPKKEIIAHKSIFQRVIKEAEAWTKLGMHPHIAYCYFVQKIDDVPYIFIEYVDGGNLAQWIAEGKCSDYNVALEMAIQFCHGMERAHGQNMIHRDIKTENILVTKEGTVKVTDFGLVSGQSEEELFENVSASDGVNEGGTVFGTKLGTPGYCAPEQWQEPRIRSARVPHGVWYDTDVFSFGICLWEMICGHKPYTNTVNITEDMIPEPRDFRADIPDKLRYILINCISPKRDKRPQNFKELRLALNIIHRELFQEDAANYYIELSETAADELNNQGYSYFQLEEMDLAKACFQKALEINKVHLQATYNLSILEWNAGEVDDLEVLKRLENCKNNPNSDRMVLAELIAYIHLQRADLEQAQQVLGTERFMELTREENLSPVYLHSINVQQGALHTLLWLDNSVLAAGESINIFHYHKSGERLGTFAGHTAEITDMLWLEQDKYFISASQDGTIRLWSMLDYSCLGVLEGQQVGIRVLAYCESLMLLAAGAEDGVIRLWDMQTKRCIQVYGNYAFNSKTGHSSAVTALTFTRDGNTLFSGGQDKKVLRWSIQSENYIQAYTDIHQAGINALVVSYDNLLLLSGSEDHSIKMWDMETGKVVKALSGHNDSVLDMQSQGFNALLLSCGGKEDKGIKLWDINHYRCIHTMQRHKDAVTALAISLNNEQAISTGLDGIIHYWDIAPKNTYVAALQLARPKDYNKRRLEREELDISIYHASSLCAAGKYLAAYNTLMESWEEADYCDDASISRVYERLKQKGSMHDLVLSYHSKTLPVHDDAVVAMQVNQAKNYFVTASYDKTVKIWSLQGECLKTIENHSVIKSIALSGQKQFLLTGDASQRPFKLWDLQSGIFFDQWSEQTGPLLAVDIDMRAKIAFSGGWDENLRVWDIESKQCIHKFSCNASIYALKSTADGKVVISGNKMGTLQVWSVNKEKLIFELPAHANIINAIHIHEKKGLAVSAGDDGMVKVWDLKKRLQIAHFQGHQGSVKTANFSHDGNFIISAGEDLNIKLWRIKNEECIYTWKDAHTDTITSTLFCQNSGLMLSSSAGKDKSVKLWRLIWGIHFQ